MNWEKFKNYTLNRIKDCKVSYSPFAHMWIDSMFDPELHLLLKEEWPAGDNRWIENTVGLNTSRVQWSIPNQRYFWDDFYFNILDNSLIRECVFQKFCVPGLDKLFYWTSSCLWEDTEGYAIGPHIDQERIIIAWQTWIDVSDNAIGTELYNNKDKTQVVKTMCMPNSGWIIMNNDSSWHGVPAQPNNTLRRSVMNRYMKY